MAVSAARAAGTGRGRRRLNPPDPGRDAGRRGPLLALLVVVALLIAAVWLVRSIGTMSRVQDCVATGGRGCESGQQLR